MATKDIMAKNRNVDDVLGQTDLGGLIAKNKKGVMALIILLIAGVIGYGLKGQWDEKKHIKKSVLLFDFMQGPLKTATEKKNLPPGFIDKLTEVIVKMNGYKGGGLLVLTATDLLFKNKMYSEAIKVLELGKKEGLAKNSYTQYLFATRLAVAQENMDMLPAAIKTLEALLTSSVKVLEGKIYLDLGRMYMALGNKKKAESNLQYVLDHTKEEEFKKMAKLYLADL